MKVRLASDVQGDSIVDGEGLRGVIWFQGCSHNCDGCHNPSSHDFNGGFLVDINEVLKKIEKLEYHQGITLSGGDPLFQIKPAIEIAKHAHKCQMDVWCYTGFLYEDILKMGTDYLEFLQNIDVLVDGKFDMSKKSMEAKFRGSLNQRIIDVKRSLKLGKAILYKDYN